MKEREPLVILQPSLHRLEEFSELVRQVANDLGANIPEMSKNPEPEEIDSVYYEVIDALTDLGFEVDTEFDSFIVS